MTLRRCLPLVLIVLLLALLSMPHALTHAAVTISSFEAQGQVGQIVVTWTTASEVNNAGFNLWRDTSMSFLRPTLLNNRQLIPSQCVDCNAGTDYVYTDTDVTSGQYYYKLESVDVGGAIESFGPVSAEAIATPSAPTRPPTHTPVPSSTPTPTDTPTPTATGTGGLTPRATPTLSTPTPTPTSTPQPGTPAATGPIATATQSAQATMPTATATLATLLPPSSIPTPPVGPGRTPTSSVPTVVAPTAAQRPTATPTASPPKPAPGGGASISTPPRPAQLLSPAAETPRVERGRLLIGVGLIGLGAVLGLSVLAVAGYLLWKYPSRP